MGARPELEGVPETLLWNLYQRAREARRPDGVLQDPRAVAAVSEIDYPFEERFGAGGLGQWQAVRVLTFDRQVSAFAAAQPGGTMVALGEGLETQFWRVDDGRLRWLTVELPEALRLRDQLLPGDSDRQRSVAGSVLDLGWMDAVDPSRGLLLTAQGLLMYLRPDEVHRLVAACAARFPGAALVFDGVAPWFSARTLRGEMRTAQGYQTPPMPWAVDAAEKDRLRALPGVAEVRDLRPPRGRGPLYGGVFPLLNRLGAVRALGITSPPVLLARFEPRAT